MLIRDQLSAVMVALPVLLAMVAVVVFPIWWRRRWYARRERAELAANEELIGSELTRQVAHCLEGGLIIAFVHRDYCGFGLRLAEGRFIYGPVHDGELLAPSEFLTSGRASQERLEFADFAAFETWLAAQTTNTLAGDGNQRLTRRRLLEAVKFCRQQPKERWPTYSG
jgi:hypothetical protein